MNTLQVRIDDKTKREAKRVLDTLGLDMSSAIKIYLRQISHVGGIPFPLLSENGFRVMEEHQLVKESNETLKQYQSGKIRGYTNTKALMRDLIR